MGTHLPEPRGEGIDPLFLDPRDEMLAELADLIAEHLHGPHVDDVLSRVETVSTWRRYR